MNRILATAAALIAGVALVAPGTAMAQAAQADPAVSRSAPAVGAPSSGSIVFLKKFNVWISDGAGKNLRQLTVDGTKSQPWASPTESDTGTVVAAHGGLVVRMDQHGTELSHFDPPGLVNSAGETMDGALNDVAVSPDGQTVAYSFVRYSCPIGVDCMVRYATGFSTAAAYHAVGTPSYYRAPSWVGNTRTLQTGGSGSQVMVKDLGAPAQHWFDDSDMNFPSTDLADGELSPDGRWLAEIRGYGASSTIAWYAVTGNATSGRPPAPPTYWCVTNADAAHAGPAWSPDSTTVAWTSKQGIVVQPDAADCGENAPASLLVKGGSAPDWSTAALTSVRPSSPLSRREGQCPPTAPRPIPASPPAAVEENPPWWWSLRTCVVA